MFVHSAADAIELMGRIQVGTVLTDIDMPGDMNGVGLARWVMENRPDARVIVVSGRFSSLAMVGSLADVPFLPKPVNLRALLGLLPIKS